MAGFSTKKEFRDAPRMRRHFTKTLSAGSGAGSYHRAWNQGELPIAEGEPISATGGGTHINEGIWFPNLSPRKKFLTIAHLACDHDMNVTIYDRLWSMANISLTSTGDKTINSVALPRYTDGAEVEPWLEFTTAISGSPNTATLSMSDYTNDQGATGKAGPSFTTTVSAPARTMIQIPLANGDLGVRAIDKLNVSSASANGVVNVVLLRKIDTILVRGNAAASVQPGMSATKPRKVYGHSNRTETPRRLERIYDGASLGFLFEVVAVQTNRSFRGYVEICHG